MERLFLVRIQALDLPRGRLPTLLQSEVRLQL